MEKNLNKDKTISEILSEIDASVDLMVKSPKDTLEGNAVYIKENIDRINKYVRGLITLLFVLSAFFIIAVVGVLMLNDSNQTVKSLNEQLIVNNKSDSQDSLKDKILVNKGSINYSTDSKGKIITYKELMDRNDQLLSKIGKFEDSLVSISQKLQMANSQYGIYFKETKVGNTKYITMGSTVFEEIDKGVKKIKKAEKPVIDSSKYKN